VACGKPVRVDDWLVSDGSTSGLPAPAALPEAGPAGDRQIGIAAAIAIIVVALLAVLLVSTLGSGEETETPTAVIIPAPTTAARESAASRADSQAAASVRSDQVASAFANEIDTDAITYGIAYVAKNSFVVLDARGISLPELEIAQQFQQVSELALLTGEEGTWAVNANDRDRSYLVSNMYVVVEAERPDTIAVIDADGESIDLLASGLPIPGVTLPAGAELIVVQQRGLIVLPRTGGTFEVSGTASSLTRLSDDRAVSASTGATAYERCDDDLQCDYFAVRTGSDDEFPLPVPPRSVVDISPRGDWAVARADDGTFLVDVESGDLVPLADGAIDAISWAPDDAFVALARGDIIEILIPTELRSIELTLNEQLLLDALLVFSS
jgi:hypothetical protein